MARAVACGLAATAVFLAVAPAAEGCTCAPLAPCESWFYTAVFQGEVIEVIPSQPALDGHRTVRMKVERTWRGEVPAEVTVMTNANEAACGYSFRPAGRYLVYAHERGDRRLWADLCSVKPLDTAGEDLAFWQTRSDSPMVGTLAVYGTVTASRDPRLDTP